MGVVVYATRFKNAAPQAPTNQQTETKPWGKPYQHTVRPQYAVDDCGVITHAPRGTVGFDIDEKRSEAQKEKSSRGQRLHKGKGAYQRRLAHPRQRQGKGKGKRRTWCAQGKPRGLTSSTTAAAVARRWSADDAAWA